MNLTVKQHLSSLSSRSAPGQKPQLPSSLGNKPPGFGDGDRPAPQAPDKTFSADNKDMTPPKNDKLAPPKDDRAPSSETSGQNPGPNNGMSKPSPPAVGPLEDQSNKQQQPPFEPPKENRGPVDATNNQQQQPPKQDEDLGDPLDMARPKFRVRRYDQYAWSGYNGRPQSYYAQPAYSQPGYYYYPRFQFGRGYYDRPSYDRSYGYGQVGPYGQFNRGSLADEPWSNRPRPRREAPQGVVPPPLGRSSDMRGPSMDQLRPPQSTNNDQDVPQDPAEIINKLLPFGIPQDQDSKESSEIHSNNDDSNSHELPRDSIPIRPKRSSEDDQDKRRRKEKKHYRKERKQSESEEEGRLSVSGKAFQPTEGGANRQMNGRPIQPKEDRQMNGRPIQPKEGGGENKQMSGRPMQPKEDGGEDKQLSGPAVQIKEEDVNKRAPNREMVDNNPPFKKDSKNSEDDGGDPKNDEDDSSSNENDEDDAEDDEDDGDDSKDSE